MEKIERKGNMSSWKKIKLNLSPYKKRNVVFFYTALVFFCMEEIISMTAFALNDYVSAILQIIRYLVYILCVIQILIVNYKTKIMLFILVGVLIGTGIFISTSSKEILLQFLLLIAAYNMKSVQIIKVVLCMQLLLGLLTVISSQLGIVIDYVLYGDRVRHFLGFVWTTNAPYLFLFIVLEYVYIKEKINIKYAILFSLVAILLWDMTDTKWAFALSMLTILIFTFFPKSICKGLFFNKEIFKLGLIISPFFLYILTYVVFISYEPSNINWLIANTVLSGRLEITRQVMASAPINFWGNDIIFQGAGLGKFLGSVNPNEGYSYVDSAYMQISIQRGMIFMFFVLAIYSSIAYYSIKKEKYHLCWITLIILILSTIDPYLYNFKFNYFPLLILTCDLLRLPKCNSLMKIDRRRTSSVEEYNP